MARLLRRCLLPLKTLAPPPAAAASASRTYISDMHRAAFKDNLLRVLRAEITYETDTRPPRPPPSRFSSFAVSDNPGEQWVLLHRHHTPSEHLKIDAAMFDGAVHHSTGHRHLSLIVEVSKPDSSNLVLNFVCSAWPDALDIEKVYPVVKGPGAVKPYMGPDFKELDVEVQDAAREYLEERGIGDELAVFLHEYMDNKDRSELVRWLKKVESYVNKK